MSTIVASVGGVSAGLWLVWSLMTLYGFWSGIVAISQGKIDPERMTANWSAIAYGACPAIGTTAAWLIMRAA